MAKKMQVFFCIIVLTYLSTSPLFAYNLTKLNSMHGLSSSAVISIYQDRRGIMWMCTYDGLNAYNGSFTDIYKPNKGVNSITGNVVRKIVETDDNVFWINTNMGVDKLDKRKNVIKNYNKKKLNFIASNSKNQFFTISDNDSISIYNPNKDKLEQYYLGKMNVGGIIHLSFDSDDILWLVTAQGKTLKYKLSIDKYVLAKVEHLQAEIEDKIHYVYSNGDMLYLIDSKNILSTFNRSTKERIAIKDITTVVSRFGHVSAIIADNNDFFIGFESGGLIKLKYSKDEYHTEIINLDCGIYSLYNDRQQDIIWIATDGFGAVMYSKDSYVFRVQTLDKIKSQIRKPVRAIYKDLGSRFWIGTKGDGTLLNAESVVNDNIISEEVNIFTDRNSALTNNSVYTYANSRRNIFWIGNDGPNLNYYSYQTQKIHQVENGLDERVQFVHAIHEQSDSILWLATSGDGFERITLSGDKSHPAIDKMKVFKFFDTGNNYYSITPENDSIIWIGNRGNGAVRFNMNTYEFDKLTFGKKEELMMNDVICIHKDLKGRMWLGTSMGLVQIIAFDKDILEYKSYTESNGLINNYIHAILEDDKSNLWLSTNNGLVEFNPEYETFSVFNQNSDWEIKEFSDNAAFKDESNGKLYFGAINGIVEVAFNDTESKIYNPDIQISGLKIFGDKVNIYDYLQNKDSKLTLPANKNIFAISFFVPDYLNKGCYTYQYKLEGLNEQWVNNGFTNEISFTNIPPGKYNLQIHYKKNNSSIRDYIYTLDIEILPPWYKSGWAYSCYYILLLLLFAGAFTLSRRWYYMKKNAIIDTLNREQEEEIYESKLRFFTNITHELSTPLTLIQGPCEKIINQKGLDDYTYKYASLINRNAKRLNSLMQEIIEFRRFETDNQELNIKELSISEHILDTADIFTHMAENKNISYNIDVKDGLIWNSDESCVIKIVSNLVSNAIKYTPENGTIDISTYLENDRLIVAISNTGQGIKEEHISSIFDRYKVLDAFEDKTGKGGSTRNGLGLAICNSMVKRLGGDIDVTSKLNEKTTFRVSLPQIEITSQLIGDEMIDTRQFTTYPIENDEEMEIIDKPFEQSKQTLLLIDDDLDMLWFIGDILSEKYNIVSKDNPNDALTYLEKNIPNLIITDVMLPQMSGIEFTQKIKQNKMLSHIPIVILSAKNDNETQVQAIEAGAEQYLSKPFSTEYLEQIVLRLIQRKEDLKEYYSSIFSSHTMDNGQIVHKEDKDFFEKFLKVIDDNIEDPALSVDFISETLGYSSRHLYRRLKSITDKTPTNIIKDYRLNIVANLLVTTNLSVEEIIYKSGFNNKGNFYKLFSAEYGQPPRAYRQMKKDEIGNSFG